MRTAFFWAITQQVVIVPYRHFGSTYRAHLQGSRTLGRFYHGVALSYYVPHRLFLLFILPFLFFRFSSFNARS